MSNLQQLRQFGSGFQPTWRLALRCAGSALTVKIQKEIEMRELTMNEIQIVSGAGDDCPSGNNYGGVTEPTGIGDDLIAIYDGLVAVVSHVIERVANAL
jgi:hypothetical protein